MSKGKLHDARVLALLSLSPGAIAAMNRAYSDYKQVAQWTEQGVYFLTRTKDNADCEAVEAREVPRHRNILSGEISVLTGTGAPGRCPHHLRGIAVWDAENEREIVRVTNCLEYCFGPQLYCVFVPYTPGRSKNISPVHGRRLG
ncbi:MAG: hypothetical protein ACLFTT_16750 [Candidatus Hydrogenedentota bacterium]